MSAYNPAVNSGIPASLLTFYENQTYILLLVIGMLLSSYLEESVTGCISQKNPNGCLAFGIPFGFHQKRGLSPCPNSHAASNSLIEGAYLAQTLSFWVCLFRVPFSCGRQWSGTPLADWIGGLRFNTRLPMEKVPHITKPNHQLGVPLYTQYPLFLGYDVNPLDKKYRKKSGYLE